MYIIIVITVSGKMTATKNMNNQPKKLTNLSWLSLDIHQTYEKNLAKYFLKYRYYEK